MKRILAVLLVLLLLIPVAAAWVLDRPAAEQAVSRWVIRWAAGRGVSVSLGELDLDPWRLGLSVRDLDVRGGGGRWSVAARRAKVRLHFWRSLLGRPLLSAALVSPEVRVTLGGGRGGAGPRGLTLPAFESLSVKDGRVEVSRPGWEGAVHLAGVGVDWVRGKGTLEVGSGEVRWLGEAEPLVGLRVRGRRRWGGIEVEEAVLRLARAELRASGSAGAWSGLDLRVGLRAVLDDLPGAWVSALRLARYAPLGGRVSFAGTVKGPLGRPKVSGRFEVASARFGPVRSGSAEGRIDLDRAGVRFQGLRARAAMGTLTEAQGEVTWGPEEVRLRARGAAQGFLLRPFMAFFVDGWFPVGLRAGGSFQAEGRLWPDLELRCRVEGEARDLDVTVDDGRRRVYDLPEGRVTGRCTVGLQGIRLSGIRVETPSARVAVPQGRIRYREGLWFDTEVTFESLAAARRWVPEPWDASGRATGRFGGPYRDLRFSYRVRAEIRHGSEDLGSVEGMAEWDTAELVVRAGRWEGALGEADARGLVRWAAPDALDLRISAGSLDLGGLAALLGRATGARLPRGLAGTGTLEGDLKGPLAAPTFEGTLALRDLEVSGWRADRLSLRGTASPRAWDAARFSGWAYGGRFQGTASGTREEISLRADVAGVDVGQLARAAGAPLEPAGRFTGRVTVRGPVAGPGVRVDGAVGGLRVDGVSVGRVTGRVAWSGGRLTWSAGAWGGRVSVQGRSGTGRGAAFHAEVEARDLPLAALPVELPRGVAARTLTGKGRVEGRIGEPLEALRARWSGAVSGVGLGGLALGEVTADLDWRGGGLAFSLGAFGGHARAQGLLSLEPGWPTDLTFRAENLALSVLPGLGPGIPGRIDAEVHAVLSGRDLREGRGVGALVELSGRGAWTGVRLGPGPGLPDGTFRVRTRGKGLEIRAAADGIEGSGRILGLEDLAWEGRVRVHDLDLAPYLPPGSALGPWSGRVTGKVRAAGRGRHLGPVSGAARVLGLSRPGLRPSDWDVSVEGTGGTLGFRGRSDRGVSVEGTWSASEGLGLVASLERVAPEQWVDDPRWPEDLRGRLTGRVRVRVPPRGGAEADVALTGVTLEIAPFRLVNRGPVALRWKGAELLVDALWLEGEGITVTASGALGPGAGWDLRVTAAGDLGLLPRWVPALRSAAGRARARIAVSGPWAAPVFQGPITIAPGASAEIRGVAIGLSDVDASAYLDPQEGLVLEWFDAQLGQGRIHVEGRVALDGYRPGRLLLWTEVRDVAYEAPPGVTYEVDADLTMGGAAAAPRISGELRLKRFLYTRRTALKTLLLELLERKARGVQTGPARQGVYVDLVIRGDRDIRVQNNLADLSLAVDLRARGYLPSPVLWGSVEAREGTVTVRGVDYDVSRSAVEFVGEARRLPLLDVHARTTVAGYAVSVDVVGPVEDYQVLLSSTPPLSRTDILALLALGTTTDELVGGQRVAATAAASLITGQVQDVLESGVGDLLGLDQFYIDPAYSPTAQSTVPRVTIGKAITRQIRARYSATIGGEVEQDLELRYTLSPHVSLLGTWSDQGTETRGSLGGEVRFRFTFR